MVEASVQPLSMKYLYISSELLVIGVAETAPKVQGGGGPEFSGLQASQGATNQHGRPRC